MEAIPQDIIELILDEVDNAGLAACALISQQFLPLCRARIFRRLSIGVYPASSLSVVRCHTFRELCTDTPYLVDYVRILTLRLDASLITSLDLCWILGKLGHLTDFHLTSSLSQPIEWGSLPSSIRSALIQCFRMSTMRSLRIDSHHGIPISVLAGATSLTHLRFSDTTWSSASPSFFLPHNLVSPTHLQIYDPYKRLKDQYLFLHDFFTPPCPFSFHALTDLDVEVTAYNKASLADLFNLCDLKLRNLEIRLGDEMSLDLSPLASLECLKMHVDLEQLFSNQEMAHKNFRGMVDTLSTSKTPTLQLLDISFCLDMDDFPPFPWHELDDTLHRISTNNPSFGLKLSQYSLNTFDQDDRFQSSMREHLLMLIGKGVPITFKGMAYTAP